MNKTSLLIKKENRWFESAIEFVIRSVASLSIILIFLIFLFVFRESLTLFIPKDPTTSTKVYSAPTVYNPESGSLKHKESSKKTAVEPKSVWDSFFGSVWQPVGESPKFGIQPLLIGTLKVTLIALIIGAPLGILAAICTSFFISDRWRTIIKPAIELLASMPSVVIGFFCLVIIASLTKDMFGLELRLNALVGGIGLAIAIIPIIFTITDDALQTVPKSLREASLALGATEWQTAFKVMLPAATPGVFSAVLLGFGRAFGETMIALMATGNAALISVNPAGSVRTLAATIGAEMGEVIWGSEHYGILFLLGSILFLISFGINIVLEFYIKTRLLQKIQGKVG
jgi:phosphate transport system permease protein